MIMCGSPNIGSKSIRWHPADLRPGEQHLRHPWARSGPCDDRVDFFVETPIALQVLKAYMLVIVFGAFPIFTL